jgi:hypothetical protein
MFKRRSLVGRAGMTLTVAAVLLAAAIMVHGSAPAPGDANKPRADIIRIDGLKQFGALERPAVIFLHEKHTQALAQKKDNKDCATCHLTDKERLSPRYMRVKDVSKQAVMDLYHDNCTACHRQTAGAGGKSGPVVCAECHRDKSPASSWKEIGLDRSLHYRHVKAQENKCEACHHEYDPAGKKLFYAKGKEGTCRYCHEEKTVENRISLRLAAHTGCVDCHRQKLAKNQSAGPLTCSGCHDADAQRKIEKVKDVPRLQRNQPDVVLVKTARAEASPPGAAAARPSVVPFNHIGHEAYSDTCRACHHASLESCVTCHTPAGIKEGRFVTLSTAMHRAESKESCVGCHRAAQAEARCAGCHAALPGPSPQNLDGCASCHVSRPATANPAVEDKALAAQMLVARKPVAGTYADEDIPETVLIKTISKQYEPVKMPHRKIVKSLVDGLKESKLAGYFHREPGTVCQSCHHHSPAAKKPPACGSCHGQPFDARTPGKPGLMAAYHIQCMECHQQMKVERPVATHCTGCHKEKL